MTLKTSSNKPHTAFNLFAFTLKKNLGFTIITSVLVFLFSPIFLINTINNYYDYEDSVLYWTYGIKTIWR